MADVMLVRRALVSCRRGDEEHHRPLHLHFDQFEELFIFGDQEEQRPFGLALRDLVSLERNVRLIYVVCEEYLGAMTEFEPLLPNLFRSRSCIECMGRLYRQAAEISHSVPCLS